MQNIVITLRDLLTEIYILKTFSDCSNAPQNLINDILIFLKTKNELHKLFVAEYATNAGLDFEQTQLSDIEFDRAPISRKLIIEATKEEFIDSEYDLTNQKALMDDLNYYYHTDSFDYVLWLK